MVRSLVSNYRVWSLSSKNTATRSPQSFRTIDWISDLTRRAGGRGTLYKGWIDHVCERMEFTKINLLYLDLIFAVYSELLGFVSLLSVLDMYLAFLIRNPNG